MQSNVLLTPEHAAARLGVAKQSLAKWRVSGTGPVFVKVGSRVFYRPQDLDAWVETRLRRSTSEYEAA